MYAFQRWEDLSPIYVHILLQTPSAGARAGVAGAGAGAGSRAASQESVRLFAAAVSVHASDIFLLLIYVYSVSPSNSFTLHSYLAYFFSQTLPHVRRLDRCSRLRAAGYRGCTRRC